MLNTKLKKISAWITPLLTAVFLFLGTRPIIAQSIGVPSIDSVNVDSVDGYTQVYYVSSSVRHYITNGNVNSRMPSTSGTFISYVSDINGAGQIFLYDAVSGSKIQLTFLGTNLNPKVDSKGRVVWEGWSQSTNSGWGTWQVFFFDGKSVKQLTRGDTSLNPDFGGEYISYGRRDVAGTWRAVVYSIKDDKSLDVAIGEESRTPKIEDGDIYLSSENSNQKKFPLSITDLFLLNLVPLNATESSQISNINAISDELTATPDAVMEVPLASGSDKLNSQTISSDHPN